MARRTYSKLHLQLLGGENRVLQGLISIEGNVAAGKSTLIRELRAMQDAKRKARHKRKRRWPDLYTRVEPTEDTAQPWCKWLPTYLANRPRWMHIFQTEVLMFYDVNGDLAFDLASDDHATKFKVIERSSESAMLFAKHGKGRKWLTDWEYDHLERRQRMSGLRPQYSIYLRTSPEEANKRKEARARDGEQHSPIDFLREMHEIHEEFYNVEAKKRANTVKVIESESKTTHEIAEEAMDWIASLSLPETTDEDLKHFPCLKNGSVVDDTSKILSIVDSNGFFEHAKTAQR